MEIQRGVLLESFTEGEGFGRRPVEDDVWLQKGLVIRKGNSSENDGGMDRMLVIAIPT